MADSAPTTSAEWQSVGAHHRIGMRRVVLFAHPRLAAANLAVAAFLLLSIFISTIAATLPQTYIVCKKLNSYRCITFQIDINVDAADAKKLYSDSNLANECFISTTRPNSGNHVPVTTFGDSYKTVLSCKSNKIVNVGALDRKTLERTLKGFYRVRRNVSYYPQGRYRGQTQSQYLAIDRGGGKDDGKAEAHSAADSSRATVTGNSGMGQAQSQSMFDPSCEDCVGRSDLGAASLKRRPGDTINHGGIPGTSGVSSTPNGGGGGAGLGQNVDPRGYGVNGNQGGTPGVDYTGRFGHPGSNGGFGPGRDGTQDGSTIYPSQGQLPGANNGVLGPNSQSAFRTNPDGSSSGMGPPYVYNQNGMPKGDNNGGLGGNNVGNHPSVMPSGISGYGPGGIPVTNDGSRGSSRPGIIGTYPGATTDPNGGNSNNMPGKQGYGFGPGGSVGGGNIPPSSLIQPLNRGNYGPGSNGAPGNSAIYPNLSGTQNGFPGTSGAFPGGSNWPTVSGSFRGPDGLNYYCCVASPSGPQFSSNGYKPPGTLVSLPNQYTPSTSGGQGPGGQLGPGVGNGQYSHGVVNRQDTGGKFVPGAIGVQGSNGQFGPSHPGGQGVTGQYLPGIADGQYGPGASGGQGVGGQISPGASGGQFGPGVGGGQAPSAQFGPGAGGGQGPIGQYGPLPGGGQGSSGQFRPGTEGGQGAGGQFRPGIGGVHGLGPSGEYGPLPGSGQEGVQGPGGPFGPGIVGGQVPGGSGISGQYGPGTTGGQFGPGSSTGTQGGQFIPRPGTTGSGGLFGPGSVAGQYGPGVGNGHGSTGQYLPGGSHESGPGGQFSPGTGIGQGISGQFRPGTESGIGGQVGPGTVGGSGTSFGPGTGGAGRPLNFGMGNGQGIGGQYSPGASNGQGTGGQIVPGVNPGGQYSPGPTTGISGQFAPGAVGGPNSQSGPGTGGNGGQFVPGIGGQYGPGISSGSGGQIVPGSGAGGQYGPGAVGGQVGPSTTGGRGSPFSPDIGGQGTGTQFGPGTGGGTNGPIGPGAGGGQGTGTQFGPGGEQGTTGQYVPGSGSGAGGQFGPGLGGGNNGQYGPGSGSVMGGQYAPGNGGGHGPGGQFGPVMGGGGSGGQFGPGAGNGQGSNGHFIPGAGSGTQFGPGVGGGQFGPGGVAQLGPGTGGTKFGPGVGGGQFGLGDSDQGTGGLLGPQGSGQGTGGQYAPGQGPGAPYPGAGYNPYGDQYGSGRPDQMVPGSNQGGTPQNVIDPNSIIDGDDSEAEASVNQAANGTVASASSKGGNDKGRAQTQVHGTYTGSGSFSAQAEISGENKAANSEVAGDKKGASSTAQGSGRNNKSQANVKLGSETGSVLTGSQSEGTLHSSNSQVQGSIKGGMADAQARGPGSTNSQAQIGFTPYKEGDMSHESQKTPFVGGGTSMAQSSGRTGMSQSQLHGTFKYGITYNGAAQAGASLDKDAVFPNRLPFDKIDVYDESNKNINVNGESDDKIENTEDLTPVPQTERPTTEVPFKADVDTDVNKEEPLKQPEDQYGIHKHADHHSPNDPTLASTVSPPVESRRSFQPTYNTNTGDYEYSTDKDDSPPEDYDVDDGFPSEGNDPAETEQGYSGYNEFARDPEATHQSLNSPKRKGLEVRQTTGDNTQHILLGSLTDHDVEITQRNSERPDESRIYQPGERVPGTGGYTIPIGFTGSVKSVASKDKTYVVGSEESPSQAQTVSLTPGSGRVNYKYPPHGKNINPKNLRSLYSPKADDNNRYVSVSKSVTRALDGENNIRKQYSHTYYTKSSSCGYFTFTCTMVSSAEGRKKVCKPKIPTNPDGTPMRCN